MSQLPVPHTSYFWPSQTFRDSTNKPLLNLAITVKWFASCLPSCTPYLFYI